MEASDPLSSERENVNRAAGIVGFFTFLSRILGLVRDMVIAGFFGSGMAADAFFVAFRIPNLLRRLFAEGSLTVAFIPVFSEYLTIRGEKDAFELARVVLTLLSIILFVVTLAGVAFAPWLVKIQAFGFGSSGTKYELTVLLTRITFPYVFFISVVAFFMGVLNSLRRFAAPAAAPIFLNVGIIGATYLISSYFSRPIIGVAIGVLIGGFFQVGLQIPWALRAGLQIRPRWQPSHPAVKRIGLLMVPAVFGSAIYQFNQFIGTLLASFLPEGSVSWLYYADRLVQFPLGVFAIAISTAALPSLSIQAASRDLDRFAETFSHALRLVFFITFPCTAGLIVLGRPIIRVFFERGAFDTHATVMTAHALVSYAVGLWAFSGIRVIVSGFYALQDTRTPVKVASVSLVANVILSLLLMGPLKHAGLALALSLASMLQCGMLYFLLRKRIKKRRAISIMGPTAKSFLAAALMGAGVHFAKVYVLSFEASRDLLSMSLNLAALIGFGVAIYISTAWILRCRELSSILEMLRP